MKLSALLESTDDYLVLQNVLEWFLFRVQIFNLCSFLGYKVNSVNVEFDILKLNVIFQIILQFCHPTIHYKIWHSA